MPYTDSGGISPMRLARLLGLFSLIGIFTGAYDLGYVRSVLFVAGDPVATVHNIFAHQLLFRMGYSSHLIELICNVIGEVLGFILFRRVNLILAGIGMCCGLIGTSIEALDMLNTYVSLNLAASGGALGGFTAEQSQTLSFAFINLSDVGLLIAMIFYGVDEFTAGFLVFRSGFLPRFLGLLIGLSGILYFLNGFLNFLAPELHDALYPQLLFGCFPGEFLLSLWVAIKGVNVAKWNAWSSMRRLEGASV